MTTAALALAILRLAGAPLEPGPREVKARILAASILRAAAAHDVPPLILAQRATTDTLTSPSETLSHGRPAK